MATINATNTLGQGKDKAYQKAGPIGSDNSILPLVATGDGPTRVSTSGSSDTSSLPSDTSILPSELTSTTAAAPTLHKSLNVFDLTSIGVGGIVGAGIFVLTGVVAARNSGPGVSISFLIAGITCSFSALCYSELSSMIPVSGSAYSFATATLGDRVGWLLGWDLVLEYSFGAATVAVGWSGYLVSILKDMGVYLPSALTTSPSHGGLFNVPAMLIVLGLSYIQYRGVQESSRFNNIAVAIKLFVLFLFLLVGYSYTRPENWQPFIPDRKDGHFGWWGILQGSSACIFSFVGFDAISTVSQEAINPQRDIPIATMGSLALCTALYVAVGIVITGLVSYTKLDVPDPIAVAVDAAGDGMLWLRPIIKLGAIFGLTSVINVLLMGQARIFYSMAEDGLLPPFFAVLHPTYRTPSSTVIFVGVMTCLVAGFFPMDMLGEMVSIGTLSAFAVVCAGVISLRRTSPHLPRPFKVPYSPYIPALGVITSLIQMCVLPLETWARLVGWMALGLVVYFGYSRHHAKPYAERLEKLLKGHAPKAEDAAVAEVDAVEGGSEGGSSPTAAPVLPLLPVGAPHHSKGGGGSGGATEQSEGGGGGGETPLIKKDGVVDMGSIQLS